MPRIRTFSLILFSLLGGGSVLSAAEGGVAPYAYELTRVWGIPITNAMLTGWVISLALILVIRLAVRRPTLVPGRGQVVVETIVDGVRGLIEPIVGRHMVNVTFPILVGFFTFILIHNWSGMIPGVGSFGWDMPDGSYIYFMRPANADLNMTLGLALVSFLAWCYFVLRYAGFGVLRHDLFGNKANRAEVPYPIYLFLFVVFFFVGLIEVISIAFRPVSLSFRLFGNVWGGENLLTGMTALFAWVLPVPFYFLEILIGLIQALVFTLLTAVYIGLICNHDSESTEHAH